jgi:hypothetical protein
MSIFIMLSLAPHRESRLTSWSIKRNEKLKSLGNFRKAKVRLKGVHIVDGKLGGFLDAMLNQWWIDSKPTLEGPHGLGGKVFVGSVIEDIAIAVPSLVPQNIRGE